MRFSVPADELRLSILAAPSAMRYHPVVVAQKAATLGLLSDNRFVLGVGSGENLNEHVVGRGWPMASVRQDMGQRGFEIQIDALLRTQPEGADLQVRGHPANRKHLANLVRTRIRTRAAGTPSDSALSTVTLSIALFALASTRLATSA